MHRTQGPCSPIFSPGFRARKDGTSFLGHGIASHPLQHSKPPAAPTWPISRQASWWEPESTSLVTWRVLISHLRAIFTLRTCFRGSFENCLHPPALIHADSVPSENMITAALRRVFKVPPLSCDADPEFRAKKYLHEHPGSPHMGVGRNPQKDSDSTLSFYR